MNKHRHTKLIHMDVKCCNIKVTNFKTNGFWVWFNDKLNAYVTSVHKPINISAIYRYWKDAYMFVNGQNKAYSEMCNADENMPIPKDFYS